MADAARSYADQLGLRNHTVEVRPDPPGDPRSLMECAIPEGREHIVLRARGDFRFQSEDEQRHALTHELVHVHVVVLEERVQRELSAEIGGMAWRIFWSAYQGDVESLVDRLAALLAPQMPLIDWGPAM